jgi:hypothetical protein
MKKTGRINTGIKINLFLLALKKSFIWRDINTPSTKPRRAMEE